MKYTINISKYIGEVYMGINRGSEWNIWDLHIHTPGTWQNNQFKHRNWEEYISTIENKNVKVLGVTNYFTIDDYFEVKKFKDKGRLKNIDLILPNVELRLDTFTGKSKGINLHIIFSDKIDEYIQPLFLDKLQFNNKDNSYSCNKKELIRLGRDFKNNPNLSEEAALSEGVQQFKVNIDDVIKILGKNNSIFKGNYLIGASNKSSDGVSGLRDGQQAAQKKKIYEYCDFIFSSTPSTIKYFLNSNENELKKQIPCIHGSDAHTYDEICEPKESRYTWIKAELSFEGLKQIKHEPRRRVEIKENHPEDKIEYNLIDKIVFNDNTNLFGDNSIHFSPGLNVIIGGKSSGKSALLYKIAQTINSSIIHNIESEKLWNNNYKNSIIDNLESKVFWKDGTHSNIEDCHRQLLYVPQMYINTLAEQYSSELLQDKIKSILLEDKNVLKSYEDYENYMKTYSSSVESKIEALRNCISKKELITEKIRSIGNLESIENEIIRLNEELQNELKESEITKEDHQKLNDIEKRKEENSNSKINNEKEVQSLNNLKLKIQQQSDNVKKEIQKTDIEEILKEYSERYIESVELATTSILEELRIYENTKQSIIEDKKEELKKIDQEITPINKKLKKKELVEKLNEQIQIEKNKKTEIQELQEVLRGNDETHNLVINEIKNIVSIYYQKIILYREAISQNSLSFNGIKIVAESKFNQEKFGNEFISKIDRRKMNNIQLKEIIDEEGNFKINDLEQFTSLVDQGIDILLTIDNNIFKKDLDRISMIRYITMPFFEILLNLSDGKDLITEMSPGKSGLVILKLLTHSNEEKYPILIDQPEDNLDNRTISTELVGLIRDISEQRQVIMVTHNANLAVLTDSENVIVANQEVSDELKENLKVRFEYINGALESVNAQLHLGVFHGKSIQEHVFDILEGGRIAFKKRENKYVSFK